jgi:hypothetical protein
MPTFNDVANLALSHLGEPLVADFETTPGVTGQALRVHLPQAVALTLESHPFSFAGAFSRLSAAPIEESRASAILDPGGINNEILVEAVTPGPAGNEISVEILPASPSLAATRVDLTDSALAISPAVATITVSGTLSPDATGPLVPVTVFSGISQIRPYPGTLAYSTDGKNQTSTADKWVTFGRERIVLPVAATLAEIAPPQDVLPGTTTLVSPGLWRYDSAGALVAIYSVYNHPAGKRWIVASDPTFASQDALEFDAGDSLLLVNMPQGFVSGLGKTWQEDPTTDYFWLLRYFISFGSAGIWTGIGPRFDSVAWASTSPTTGTPGFSAAATSAAAIIAAITAHPSAAALVTAANTNGSDGSGQVAPVARTFLAGGSSDSVVFAPGWHAAYNLPANCLRVIEIDGFDPDAKLDRFEVMGRHLLLPAPPPDPAGPVVRFIRADPPPETWPADFTEAVSLLLASRLASTTVDSPDLARHLLALHEAALGRARSRDTRETRSKENHGPRQLAARSPLVQSRFRSTRPLYP